MATIDQETKQELEENGITLDDILVTLDAVRESGKINMFTDALSYWMETFSERQEAQQS